MTHFNIQTFTGSIQNQSVQLINARELHQLLQVKTRFDTWINRRLTDSPFRENVDFLNVINFERVKTGLWGSREVEVKDYHLTLDTAKHLCLMENTEIGYQIRQQFIDNDNKARIEINLLRNQIAKIPPFLLNNPDHTLQLVKKARQALFLAYPECEKIVMYREMGLDNHEIGKLLDLGKKALETRLRKLFDLGLLQRKPNYRPAKQLGLDLVVRG